MRTIWIGLGAALLAVLIIGGVACGDDEDEDGGGAATATTAADETPPAGETPADGGEEGVVAATLSEYQILLDIESAPAGSVTFNASNIGEEDHELVVIKTDLARDALPTAEDGSVDEAGEGIEVLGEIEEFAPETEGTLMLDLEAGAYVLICNVVEEEDGAIESHYDLGMHTAFEVTG
jgi:hypothetical protein